MLFAHKVEKIKGASHKNGDVDSTCQRGYKNVVYEKHVLILCYILLIESSLL